MILKIVDKVKILSFAGEKFVYNGSLGMLGMLVRLHY